MMQKTQTNLSCCISQCPQKSMLVFSVLCVVWLVLCIIPTRYIILSAGLVSALHSNCFVRTFNRDTVNGIIQQVEQPNSIPIIVARSMNS